MGGGFVVIQALNGRKDKRVSINPQHVAAEFRRIGSKPSTFVA